MVKAAQQADRPTWTVSAEFTPSPPFQQARDQFQWALDTLQAIQDTAGIQGLPPAITDRAEPLMDQCVDLAKRLAQLQALSLADCCAKAELLGWMLDDDPDLTGALTASLCRDLKRLSESLGQAKSNEEPVLLG